MCEYLNPFILYIYCFFLENFTIPVTHEVSGRLVRCSQCTSLYSNAARKRNRWRSAAGVPTKKVERQCTQYPLWQVVTSPADLSACIAKIALSSDSEDAEQQLISIATHAALEPDVFRAINPVELSNGQIVSLCPSLLEAELMCSCKKVSIKQRRSENILHCDVCSGRLRQREVRRPAADPELTTKSPFCKYECNTKQELVEKCKDKSAALRKLRCQYARSCAEVTRAQAKCKVVESQQCGGMSEHTATSVQEICANLCAEPAEARTLLESALRSRYEVLFFHFFSNVFFYLLK